MPVNPITCILDRYPTMILDGALSTALEGYGCDLNDPLWSAKVLIENPQAVYQTHYDYFVAGADCAITSSYQASFQGFAKRGISHQQSVALLQKTVEIAQKARHDFLKNTALLNRPIPLIAASIGPYGAYLADGSEYKGEYGVTNEVLKEFHSERIDIVLRSGADILACETLPSIQEATVLLELLAGHPQAHAWFSFTLRDAGHISDGSALHECVALLDQSDQVAAIGVNCIAGSCVSEAIAIIRQSTQKPVIVYPNGGQIYDPVTKSWHSGDHHQQKEGLALALQWVEQGARLIGGCCGTMPADIHWLATLLRSKKCGDN